MRFKLISPEEIDDYTDKMHACFDTLAADYNNTITVDELVSEVKAGRHYVLFNEEESVGAAFRIVTGSIDLYYIAEVEKGTGKAKDIVLGFQDLFDFMHEALGFTRVIGEPRKGWLRYYKHITGWEVLVSPNYENPTLARVTFLKTEI